jgi:hypothetical protein
MGCVPGFSSFVPGLQRSANITSSPRTQHGIDLDSMFGCICALWSPRFASIPSEV